MGVIRISPSVNNNLFVGKDLYIIGNDSSASIIAGFPGMISPSIRFDKIENKWQFSNDGIYWQAIGTSSSISIQSGSYSETKLIEIIQQDIPQDTIHALPENYTYVVDDGNKLDLYLNGQLLTYDHNFKSYDYEENDEHSIKFHFSLLKNSVLTYIIK